MLILHVLIELFIRQFVSLFVLSVIFAVLLDCVIGQVNGWRVVVQLVFVRGCSDVSALVKVASELAVY